MMGSIAHPPMVAPLVQPALVLSPKPHTAFKAGLKIERTVDQGRGLTSHNELKSLTAVSDTTNELLVVKQHGSADPHGYIIARKKAPSDHD